MRMARPFSDLVCYWFRQSRKARFNPTAARRVPDSSQRTQFAGAKNRAVLDRISDRHSRRIIDAWSGRTLDRRRCGRAGYHSCASRKSATEVPIAWLNGTPVRRINADLTTSTDLTTAKKLRRNRGRDVRGRNEKGRSFDVPGELVSDDGSECPRTRMDGQMQTYSDHAKNGMDVDASSCRRPWIIDFEGDD